MDVTLDVSAVPARPAGAGRYITELARELGSRLGSSLGLVCVHGDETRWQVIAPQARVFPVSPTHRVLRLGAEQLVAPWRPRRPAGTIWHGPHYTLPLAYHRGPRVVTVHDLSLLAHPEWHERSKVAYFGRMIPLAIRRADHVVCVSERTRHDLLERFALEHDRVSVTPLGLDDRWFGEPAPPGESSTSALAGRPYLLALGTAEPRKNLDRLVAAFDAIADHEPGLVLAIAGHAGWRTEPVRKAVEGAAHRDRIVELGYVPEADLRGLLAGARALCYPSLYEGFGLPVLEAMAGGTVVVTSLDTAMADHAAGAAICVDPTSTEAIARGLRAALDLEGADRDALTRRARTRAAEFRWSRTAETTIAGYERAIANWSSVLRAGRRPRDRDRRPRP